MKPEEFSKNAAAGKLGPLYFLYGDEQYLVDRDVAAAVAAMVSPDFRDFSYNVFYGGECRGEEIADTAATLPFLADRRVVVVRNADSLPAAALEALLPYISDPSPATTLIFVGAKIDQRKKFFTEFKKKGELVQYRKLYEENLPSFVRSEAVRQGKRIDPPAVELLVYLTGNDLRELSTQVDKAASYVGDADTITVDAVRQTVSDARVDSVFEFANSLGEKDAAKALRRLQALFRDGEDAIHLLFVVARHFRQLWMIRDLVSRKAGQDEIAAATGLKSTFFLPGLKRQAQNFTGNDMKRIFRLLYESDGAAKSGRGSGPFLMERLVMEICGRKEKARR